MAIVHFQSLAGSSRIGALLRYIITYTMRAEPRASCWICRNVWQQSITVFYELRSRN